MDTAKNYMLRVLCLGPSGALRRGFLFLITQSCQLSPFIKISFSCQIIVVIYTCSFNNKQQVYPIVNSKLLIMKKYLLSASILLGTFLSATLASGQQSDRFAYAVTDVNQQGASWSFLRKLNLQTGAYSEVLLSGNDASLLAYDASTKKQFAAPLKDAQYGNIANAAFGTGVAAMAYDKKNNRLYYTPMLIDQLRYLDLKTMKVFYVADRSFTGKPQKSPDQGNIVTRMVIAADGNGYAMTNDATQLIRFSTGKKLAITDLGSLVDDQANKDASVHNSCSSYGGDMIADDDGNLYVFSARNHVFKVNIESKVARHLGIITGLPKGFTVNGAAVMDDNGIVVSSAVQSASYFTIDHKTLTASPYKIAGTVWQSSDLANSNLLVSGKKTTVATNEIISKNALVVHSDNNVSIYPNPVTDNRFALQFNQLGAGKYVIQVTNMAGSPVYKQNIVLNGENQYQPVKLNGAISKAVYLLQVINDNGKVVFSSKLVLQ
jgi:Secretion system C-terminal sorting domain